MKRLRAQLEVKVKYYWRYSISGGSRIGFHRRYQKKTHYQNGRHAITGNKFGEIKSDVNVWGDNDSPPNWTHKTDNGDWKIRQPPSTGQSCGDALIIKLMFPDCMSHAHLGRHIFCPKLQLSWNYIFLKTTITPL